MLLDQICKSLKDLAPVPRMQPRPRTMIKCLPGGRNGCIGVGPLGPGQFDKLGAVSRRLHPLC
jgi:hypothetical protein